SGVCKERATTSGPKRTAAQRVAPLFGSGFVTPRSQPHFGGCSLVAPRQNRKATQQTWSYLCGPHPGPTPALSLGAPLGRGRMVQRLSITPGHESAQRPSAKHQSEACCSLSLRERVRVRGKCPVEHSR